MIRQQINHVRGLFPSWGALLPIAFNFDLENDDDDNVLSSISPHPNNLAIFCAR
jgi:hypothetical protein